VLLIATSYSKNPDVDVALITLSAAFSGLTLSGFSANVLDLASDLASTLQSLSNTAGTLGGIFTPILTGVFLDAYGNQTGFLTTFWVCFAFYGFGGVAWAAWMSTEQVLD